MNKIKLELKWSLIFIVMMLLWMLLERLAGLHDKNIELHPIVTNFVAIPAILIYVFALREKKLKFYNGVVSYKQAFVTGAIMTLIITLFSPLTQYITSAIITPDYFKNAINYAITKGYSSKEQAEAYFSMGNYIQQTLIGTPVMGLITTAIVSIFIRSKQKKDV